MGTCSCVQRVLNNGAVVQYLLALWNTAHHMKTRIQGQAHKPSLLASPCPALQAKRAASAEGSDIPAIPVTVRQLEAVIRIAESLAKMQLQVGEMGPSFAQKSTSLWAGERVAAGAAEWRMGWGR